MKRLCIIFSLNALDRVQAFWECFVDWWRDVAHENLMLTLKDVMLGFPERKDILNYLLILSKLCIWECGRSINLFLYKIKIKKNYRKSYCCKEWDS